MTLVHIHQPDFLPWLGFFDRLCASDITVILDDAQFLRRGWHHRDRIKTPAGPAWLTVPVVKKGRGTQAINEVQIKEEADWRFRHLETVRHAYHAVPAYNGVAEGLANVYARGHIRLMDLNMDLLRWVMALMDVERPLLLASELDQETELRSTARLVRLVERAGGQCYLSGSGARDYLDEGAFQAAGLDVIWQAFRHPVYPQLHGAFEPGLSILDALINLGGIGAAAMLAGPVEEGTCPP